MYLADYHIFPDLIDENARTRTCRGIRYGDRRPVLLKCLKSRSPSMLDLSQSKNDYAITQMMDTLGVVRSVELLYDGPQVIVVLDDNGSGPMDDDLSCQPMALELFWPFALQLAEILNQLETHQVIHQAINLRNLWIHPETRQVTLMNFEQASCIAEEGLDDRADYYGLGSVFQRVLKSGMPSMLSEIVAKLMAESPQSHYQSAQGVRHDLLRCQADWQRQGTIDSFELGTGERPDRFRVSTDRIYGRDAEIATLKTMFLNVSEKPDKSLLLISGASGVGKTAIVEQFYQPLQGQKNGLLIRGKFDQLNRHLPLSAILQAFRDLVRQWLTKPDTLDANEGRRQISVVREKLLEALGNEAQVLLDVLPELAQIIGPQPPVIKLSDSAQGNRFNLILLRFVRVLATPQTPLILFLDDVQWADRASLELIKQWMFDYQLRHFLCIAAYRNHEVSVSHPFIVVVEALRDKNVLIQEMPIFPLAKSALNQLVAESLHCHESLSLPLGHEIWRRTQGNPFFSIQILKAFYQDGHLFYNHTDGCWQCDLSQIRAAEISDDVVEFMIDRLKRLTSPTRSVLALAACLGNEFDLETLATISHQSVLTAASKLWRALQEEFVIPTTQIYKFYTVIPGLDSDEDSTLSGNPNPVGNVNASSVFGSYFGSVFESVTYRFLHDRVQQAAYGLIPPQHRATTHLRIGRLLLNSLGPSLEAGTISDTQLFDLMSQLNQGLAALNDPIEQIEIASLNLRAGKRAASSTAYESALNYAEMGISLLPIDRWEQCKELSRSLYTLAAEVSYLSGQFDQTPEFVKMLQQNAQSVVDNVSADEIQIRSYAMEGKTLEAVKTALDALKKLGFNMPLKPNKLRIAWALLRIRWIFTMRSPETFLALPTMINEEMIAATRVIEAVSYLTAMSAPELYPELALVAVQLSIKFGNSSYSAYGYACNAAILSGFLNQANVGYKIGQLALSLIDRYDLSEIEPRIKIALAVFVNHRTLPLCEIVRSVESLFQMSLDIGDLDSAAWAMHTYSYHQYYAGCDLAVLEQYLAAYLPIVKKINQVGALRFMSTTEYLIVHLQRASSHFTEHSIDQRIFDRYLIEAQTVNSRSEIFAWYYYQGMICYLFGDYEAAYQKLYNAHSYRDAATSLMIGSLYYFYRALSAASCHDTATMRKRFDLRKLVRHAQRHLDRCAKDCPENYANKYSLVKAEYARIKGDRTGAMDAYEKAIALAQEHKLQHELALAYELAARFYAQWKQTTIAQTYMTQAYYAYEKWGATAKCDQLKRCYPYFLEMIPGLG